jgi:hypothetical protein
VDREDAKVIAKKHAAASTEEYTQVADFEPHEWVINAIIVAAYDARTEGFDEGYEEGYSDGLNE